MDRQNLDRIIITSNAKMMTLINWYNEHEEWLSTQEFHAPMDAGVIELQEENLEFTFLTKGNTVEIAIYPTELPHVPAAITYQYTPATREISNVRVASHLPKEKQDIMKALLLTIDNTPKKEAIKYHVIMSFMTYYRDVITITKEQPRTKREAKMVQRLSGQPRENKPLPLVQKVYVLEDINVKDLKPLQNAEGKKEPHAYTKPNHEVHVRGYLRRYATGKEVWIKPHTRYKNKEKQPKRYEF